MTTTLCCGCWEKMKSFCPGTLMASLEHRSGTGSTGNADDGGGGLHLLFRLALSSGQAWWFGSAPVGSFSASSVCVKVLHNDHFQFHPLESADN